MIKCRLTDQEVLDIPVEVPVAWAKDAPVRYDWEKMQILNLPLIIDTLSIRPPSMGVWTMLELIDAREFVVDYEKLTVIDIARVLYINEFRQEAAIEFNQWLLEDSGTKERGETELDIKIGEWFAPYAAAVWTPEALVEIREWFSVSWNGYTLFPKGNAGPSEADWFGATRLGGIIATCGEKLGASYEDYVWAIPLCLLGHTVAQNAIVNGNKHMRRPKDEEHVKKLIAESKVMIAEGKLLPWQEKCPDGAFLTSQQVQYGGKELADRLAELKKAVKKKTVAERRSTPEETLKMLKRIKEIRESHEHY